ncbi:hypothetical protein [Pseudomonas sp. GD03746]|uniref:hypothetical protein n=1 Tax=Pseudomonas sp. GD03746 TaxID=2975378 RepID=UPI0024493C08|nr:hypothetical protein [Pseudomonas sp. GD03746]MDH1574254.1 hypothetical protein [Pseudomonas sp. GD03746]
MNSDTPAATSSLRIAWLTALEERSSSFAASTKEHVRPAASKTLRAERGTFLKIFIDESNSLTGEFKPFVEPVFLHDHLGVTQFGWLLMNSLRQ